MTLASTGTGEFGLVREEGRGQDWPNLDAGSARPFHRAVRGAGICLVAMPGTGRRGAIRFINGWDEPAMEIFRAHFSVVALDGGHPDQSSAQKIRQLARDLAAGSGWKIVNRPHRVGRSAGFHEMPFKRRLTDCDDQDRRGSRPPHAYRARRGGRKVGYPATMVRASVGDFCDDGSMVSEIGDADQCS